MTNTFEELVQLKQDQQIGWVEFMQRSEYADAYKQWLSVRGEAADEQNAELFYEMTDAAFQNSQEMVEDYYEIQ